jgi:tetratricopeptide (TPR) repeat protein
MAKHPGQRRRLTQNKAEIEEDIFIAKVLGFWTWAKSNQTFLTVAALVAAVAVGSFFYYRSYRRGLVAQADTAGAKSQLKIFVTRFGGTPYEGEARMLLGEIYLEGGNPQQAQAVLEPMAGSPSTPLQLQAAGLLARSYEQENRWKEAEDMYLRIADRSNLDFQVRGALADAARIRANHGDKAGAIELYKRILDGLDKNSPERGLYEMRLAELSAESLPQAQAKPQPQGSGGA